MSLRTNVCPVDLRERAQVRCWKRVERKMNKAGDVKEGILGRKICGGGGWEARREEAEEKGRSRRGKGEGYYTNAQSHT